MRLPKFGKSPDKKMMQHYASSPAYVNGKFENIVAKKQLADGYNYFKVIGMMFKNSPDRIPKNNIPSVKTEIKTIPADEDVIIWFGHSSYYMQIDGKKFLVDPVFSGNVSPALYPARSFKGTDIYTVNDFPEIDYLIITHDHYDHLDYKTVNELKGKVKKIICPLGVGTHLKHWGYSSFMINEMDWNTSLDLDTGFKIYCESAQHFSGRTFARGKTLWASFLLQTPSKKIFIGGDSGYGKHFKETGEKHNEIDIAILESGQYNAAWQPIHMLPEETLQAAKDLNAKKLFPVHSSKFRLAMHKWNEPLEQVSTLNKENIPLITPVIGEIVYINNDEQKFAKWWQTV